MLRIFKSSITNIFVTSQPDSSSTPKWYDKIGKTQNPLYKSFLNTVQQIFLRLLLGSDEGKEHVECYLDTVDEDQSVLGGNELEVDGMDEWPNLPRSLAGSEQIILDLASDSRKGVSVDKSKVCEENGHEDWAPDDLIECNLHGNSLSVLSGDQVVKPVVEVVSRGSVVKETKGRHSNETLHVEWSSTDENLEKYTELQVRFVCRLEG